MPDEPVIANCSDVLSAYRKVKGEWLSSDELSRLQQIEGLDEPGTVVACKRDGAKDLYQAGVSSKAASDLGGGGVASALESCIRLFSDAPAVCESLAAAVTTPISCKDGGERVAGTTFSAGDVLRLWDALSIGPDMLFFNQDSAAKGDVCIYAGNNRHTIEKMQELLEDHCPVAEEQCEAIGETLGGVRFESDHWSAGWAFAVSGVIVHGIVSLIKFLWDRSKGGGGPGGTDSKKPSVQEIRSALDAPMGVEELKDAAAPKTAAGITVAPVAAPVPSRLLVPVP
jgi:hypothetical protein